MLLFRSNSANDGPASRVPLERIRNEALATLVTGSRSMDDALVSGVPPT